MTEPQSPILVQQASAMTEPQSPILVQQASAMTQAQPVLTRKQPDNNNNNVVYLYYDPRQLQTNTQGQLVLPETVQDAQGHVVAVQSLLSSSSNNNQIYLEPPPSSHRQQQQPRSTLEQPSAPAAASELLTPPLATMQVPSSTSTTNNNTSSSSSYDQSILVSTVGIMALLVGALSARRMRSRSYLLQVCIENESLEEQEEEIVSEALFHQGSYQTFGGWKGDLEKFDV
jgi:hypothetical protein